MWPYVWGPKAVEAVDRSAGAFDGYWVLIAEANATSGELAYRKIAVNWRAFAGKPVSVVPVIRIERMPATGNDRQIAASLLDVFRSAKKLAAEPGVKWPGLQLDYDCPTERLEEYAHLLDAMRSGLPKGAELSITALPDWLHAEALRGVLNHVDFLVLQVHSLGRFGSAWTVCDTDAARKHVAAAAEIGKPFFVALPSIGYRIRPDVTAQDGIPGRLMSDPVDIAALVRDIRSQPSANLRGIAWFRLPVEGDELNWSWPVLASVMQGLVPETDVRAEVRAPRGDLREVWVRNLGTYQPNGNARLQLVTAGASPLALDTINGFRKTDGATPEQFFLEGPVPPAGGELMAGWFVFAKERTETDVLCVEQVEIRQ